MQARKVILFFFLSVFIGAGAAPKQSQRDVYVELQRQLVPALRWQQWDKALEIAGSYKKKLGTYPDYQSLMETLARPLDSAIVVYPFPNTINTMGDEYGPVLSSDGKTLLFCGRDRRDNLRGEDIYISQFIDNDWSRARLVRELCSTEDEAPLSLSFDGTELIFFRRGQLAIAHKSERGWLGPMQLPEIMRLSSWQADAMLSADGKALIFVSDAPTEREQFMSPNIYVSLLGENGKWGKPFELGPTINTPYIDRSPFLHPDMKTLYFASEGHGSLGGLDVYMTTRLNPDSWTEWSEPVNLGKQINTAGNDCWYKISTDGTMAYLSRSTANNMQDICWLPLPGYLRAEPMMAEVAEESLMIEENIVRLNNIFFPFGSAQLLSTSEPELERVLKALHGTGNRYEIAGHTDNVGSAEANQLLSERRAAAVRDWLVEHGCAAERLTIRGYGESEPIADNSTAEGRTQNRRVELRCINCRAK